MRIARGQRTKVATTGARTAVRKKKASGRRKGAILKLCFGSRKRGTDRIQMKKIRTGKGGERTITEQETKTVRFTKPDHGGGRQRTDKNDEGNGSTSLCRNCLRLHAEEPQARIKRHITQLKTEISPRKKETTNCSVSPVNCPRSRGDEEKGFKRNGSRS